MITRLILASHEIRSKVAADLEAKFFDPFRCEEVLDVDRDDEVTAHRAGGAGFGADDAAADEVHERVGAPLRDGPEIAGRPVDFHLGLHRAFEVVGVVGIEPRIEDAHTVERLRQVRPPPLVTGLVVARAAVTVDRVGDPLQQTGELVRGVYFGDPDQYRFEVGDLVGPFGRVHPGDHGRVRPGDVTPGERFCHGR